MSESIYNLVPKEYIPPKKEPMYMSKHNPDPSYPGSTFGCTGTTRLIGAGKLGSKEYSLFGPKKNDSAESLQKSANIDSKTSNQPFRYTDIVRPKIPGPETTTLKKESKPPKNFITANAVEAILKVPKSLNTREINYLEKEDYGKAPAYLSQVKEEIRREKEMIQQYVKEQLGETDEEPEQYDELSENERRQLIDALKLKWDTVNAQYQKITHLVRLDTTGKKKRKETLESELRALETDIEKLCKPGPILVAVNK